MITKRDFERIIKALGQQGTDDIRWSENLREPETAEKFAAEAIYVICNSGMKNAVAVGIFKSVMEALRSGHPAFRAFKHRGKAEAIDRIWRNRSDLLA